MVDSTNFKNVIIDACDCGGRLSVLVLSLAINVSSTLNVLSAVIACA